MNQNNSVQIYKFTLFLLFCYSMYPWFVWDIKEIYFLFPGALISVLFYFTNRHLFRITKRKIILSFILCLAIGWSATRGNINGAIGKFFIFTTILVLINTKDNLKATILKFITDKMAILLAVSLIFYLLFLTGINLPHTKLNISKLGYSGLNYYGFITLDGITEFSRFKSIFAEPGHLSLGLIPLLYANRLNLKNKSVIVIFIAQLLSLSLAGYITLILSLAIFSFSSSKSNRYAKILLLCIILFSTFLLSSLKDDNVINKAIVSRLKYDNSIKTIIGDNRTKDYTDTYYDNFIKSSDFLTGVNSEIFEEVTLGSAGYKVYIIRYGLIGTFLVLLLYISYTFSYRKYETWGLLLIILLQQYQGGVPFWYASIIGFILGISVLYYEIRNEVKYERTPVNSI